MSEPKFGEWQNGPVPKNTPVLMYCRNSAYHGDMAVLRYLVDTYGCWMPLPPPPKEEWEEAWNHFCVTEEFGCVVGDSPFRKAFRKGFEAGRKK